MGKAEDYLGIPWEKEGGDSKTSFNCITFILTFQDAVFGRKLNWIELKSSVGNKTEILITKKSMSQLNEGDLITFQDIVGVRKYRHIGCKVSSGMIHCSTAVGVSIMSFYNLGQKPGCKFYSFVERNNE